jgi:hypothetical protein
MGGARLVEPLPREGFDRWVSLICFSRPACFLLRTLSLVVLSRELDGTSRRPSRRPERHGASALRRGGEKRGWCCELAWQSAPAGGRRPSPHEGTPSPLTPLRPSAGAPPPLCSQGVPPPLWHTGPQPLQNRSIPRATAGASKELEWGNVHSIHAFAFTQLRLDL